MKIRIYPWIICTILLAMFCAAGPLRAESLLSIQDGCLFVTGPGAVDITLTCGQWGPHDEGAEFVYLHQGPYLDDYRHDLMAFGNWELGKQACFRYFPQGRELVFSIMNLIAKTRYYTGPAERNPDNLVHALIEPVAGADNTVLVRFEHSPYGGGDNFTDTQFTVTAAPSPAQNPPDPAKARIGINPNATHYYATQFLFVDAMKTAMPWVTQNSVSVPGGTNPWDSGVIDRIPCDSDGYPLELPYPVAGTEAPQIVATLLFRVEGVYPGGTYTVLYDGTGSLKFYFDARVIHEDPGKMLLDVTPSANGIMMKIASSDPNDHIRNIRVIMPGYESSYEQVVFYPAFTERFAGMNAIRFMDLEQTNGSPLVSWSQRPTPSSYTQGGPGGIALEHMVDLANRMGADAWFCVPHMADDEYVRNMAVLLRDSMAAGRRIYIEYSNEVWNGIFPQTRYSRDMGCGLQLCDDCYDGVNDGSDVYWSGIAYSALRSVEIFQIFDQEFAGDERLVKVLSGQAASSSAQDFMLQKFHDLAYNPAGVTADALAIAGYFGADADLIAQYGEVESITVQEILKRSEESITRTIHFLGQNKSLADLYGLETLAYEGGQHLAATGANTNNDLLTSKLIAANRDPGMGTLYEMLFDAWFQYGGGPFMVFSAVSKPSRYGSWGILESLDQPAEEAPKYLAVMNYLQDAVNLPPVAQDMSVTTDEDTPVEISLAGSDPEGSTLAFHVVSGPAHGMLSGTGPMMIYTPAADYHGLDSFTYAVSDGELDSDTATVSITIESVNDQPIAFAGPDQAVVAVAAALTPVTLDGSASYDPDGDELSYQWTWEGGSATGVSPTVMLPPGTTVIQLQVHDGLIGSTPDAVDITILDETPPEIQVSVKPKILWPPNHKMIPVVPAVSATDNCDPAPEIRLHAITMSEGDVVNTYDPNYDASMEDGDTTDDIRVGSDGSIFLRSERKGSGDGRTYTLVFEARDASGNTSLGSATVTVPHNL